MASKIKVDQIEGAAGTTVTLPAGQTLDLSSGTVTLPNASVTNAQLAGSIDLSTKVTGTLASGNLPTVPVSKGGTGVISLGTANQVLAVNSGATALEFVDASGGKVLGTGILFNSNSRTTWSSIGSTLVGVGNLSDFYYPNNSNCYMEGSYTKQSATSNLFVWGHITTKSSTNSHDAAIWIIGDEGNGRILHLDEHNGARNYLSASFNTVFTGVGTGSKTFRMSVGTGDSRTNSGIRGVLGSDVPNTDISYNAGQSYMMVMEVEV